MSHPPKPLASGDPSALFAAQGAFAADLATFQAMAPTCASYEMEDVLQAFAPAHLLGFAYSISHGLDSIQVSLLHKSGWDQMAAMDGGNVWKLLADLAGICLGDGTATPPEPVLAVAPVAEPGSIERLPPGKTMQAPPAVTTEPTEPAEPDEFGDDVDAIGPGTPNGPTNQEDRAPLNESDRETCLAMIRALTPNQRKQFTVAFRSHFNIGRESKTIASHIVHFQHQRFIQLFVDELELNGAAA